MAQQKYATKDFNPENMARAKGRTLSISTKKSVEVCNFIRHKNIQKAKEILNKVIAKEQPVPFKRYNRDIPHKKEIAGGRYPVKASKEILAVLKSAESNAQFKGLNTADLVIKHICAHKAGKQMHYGRRRGRTMKRTHIEVVLARKSHKKTQKKEEKPKKEKAAESKKSQKKESKEEKEQQKNKQPKKEDRQESKEKKKSQKKKTEQKEKNSKESKTNRSKKESSKKNKNNENKNISNKKKNDTKNKKQKVESE